MTDHLTDHLTGHPTPPSTDRPVEPVTEPIDVDAPERPTVPSPALDGPAVLRVVKDQRKIIAIAVVLAVASFWIVGQLGRWEMAGCLAIGVGLGLLNHLATELWLLRIVRGHAQPDRGDMIRATMVRLVVLVVVAVGLAVLLWPDGIALLLGLAIFRLIALMMTSLTLLKELKEQ